ncbi:MAG: hypothetical protein KatS3mg060_1717 [Dehalococcoidia bacterium]|nr:MAG: hypothetical protein KatS3mg060_1717 [Dehalococcoidia bacterium]
MSGLEEWLNGFPMVATRGSSRLGVRFQPRVVVYPNGGVELGGRAFRSIDDAVTAFEALLVRAHRHASIRRRDERNPSVSKE